jgi:hypothetical protein
MTSRQAIRESIRRWTQARAFAYEEPCALAEEQFQVGYTDGWRDIILGFGATWEEAFGLADETPIDTSHESWWGPHPDGIQQRHASWCRAGASCTCSSIRRTLSETHIGAKNSSSTKNFFSRSSRQRRCQSPSRQDGRGTFQGTPSHEKPFVDEGFSGSMASC